MQPPYNAEADPARPADYADFVRGADGVIRPEVDQLSGACKDWFAVQHFVSVSDGTAAVVWSSIDSPLITLQDINRGQWYKELKIENGNIFAYIFNNYWYTNYKATQEGPLEFRFAVTSAPKISDAEAKKFGESVQSSMIARVAGGTAGKEYPEPRSFVHVKNDNVLIQAIKPARFADGTIIRLREMSGRSTDAVVDVSGIGFKQVYQCNLAEDKSGPLIADNGIIRVPCRGFGLATVLLER